MKRKYILQLLTFNRDNPLQALEQEGVEGNSLMEIASKISLIFVRQMQREHEEKLGEFRATHEVDDDIPF